MIPIMPGGAAINIGYLTKIEQLSHAMVEAACIEKSFEVFGDAETKTPPQSSITALARELHFVHWSGDGCVDHD